MTGFVRFWEILIAKLPMFLPYLLTGALVTLKITGATLVVAGLFGLLLALMQRTRAPITGTIAVAPSANINPERQYPSMFEPVHGSAPDIAGQGIANPIGQIWSAAMMLDHLGEGEAGAAIMTALEQVLTSRRELLTPDLGGKATTAQLGEAIAQAVARG